MLKQQRSELIQFAKSPSNDGLSIWVSQGRHMTLSLMRSKPKGTPKFNCHEVYLVLEQKHAHQVLADEPYHYFKAFFWIGSRAQEHQSKVEKAMEVLDQVIEAHPKNKAKLRVYIEYQYAESFDFLTLFQRIQQSADEKLFYALQYQDFVRDESADQKQRAIAFPKVLIFEQIQAQGITQSATFVRIYERGHFESNCPQTVNAFSQSNLAFLRLDGKHVTQDKRVVTDMAAGEPFSELITGGELLVGGHASSDLRAFASTFCQAMELAMGPEAELDIGRVHLVANVPLPAAWQELVARSTVKVFEDRSKIAAYRREESKQGNQEWLIVKQPRPYVIVSHEWKKKTIEERQQEINDLDTEPVLFKGPFNPGQPMYWEKKPDFRASFDPNQVNMFRVILEPNFVGSAEVAQELDMSVADLYSLQLEKLKISRMSHEMMSSRQIYLFQTPVRLYIWLGNDLEQIKRNASLRILQSFSKNMLDEVFSYRPGYYFADGTKQNILTMRLRIEYQGYESRQLAALLGKMTVTPGSDNRMDYIMLRMPKLTADADDEAEEAESSGQGSRSVHEEGMSFALNNALKFAQSAAPSNFRRGSSMKSTQGTINNLRMSVKVNLRATESKLLLRNLNLLTQQRSSEAGEEEKKGLDIEESKQRQNLIDNMMQTRQEDQVKCLEQIRAKFNPLSIVQGWGGVAGRQNTSSAAGSQTPGLRDQKGEFDAIWQFVIHGRKFEQVENPLKVGILESQKCYFLLFYKRGKVSIVMWRGKDQSLLDFSSSIKLFKQTKFRLVKNGLRAKGNRSQSNAKETLSGLQHNDLTAFLKGEKGTKAASGLPSGDDDDSPAFGDIGKGASQSEALVHGERLAGNRDAKRAVAERDAITRKELKYTFRPIDQVQITNDAAKLVREHAINLEPVKRDDLVTEINLRSLVQMDNEPMHLLQAFQGSLVVTTNEYLTREMATYEGQDDQDEQYVMLFQILGLAGLNQRAREVPPFKPSLTTTGLFVLLTRSRILFWAGSEYFASYLGENSFDQFQNLISEELLTKLVMLYDQSQSLTATNDDDNQEESKNNLVNLEDRKISFCVEGIEGAIWQEYMTASRPATVSTAAKMFQEQQAFAARLGGIARSTTINDYRSQRTEAFNRMRAVDEALDESEDSQESSKGEDEDSDDFSSSDEDIEMFDYDNEITQDLWLPSEPKLFVIYNGKRFVSYDDAEDLVNREPEEAGDGGQDSDADLSDEEGHDENFRIENHRTHSEYMTMKQVNNFRQESLQSQGIYMLDFDSEVFVWVGSKVPSEKYVQCFKKVGNCARSVSSKGHKRRDKVAFSFTWQGFEPEIFKTAFPAWTNFARAGIDAEDADHISEESDGDSQSNSDNAEEESKANTEGGSSTAAATNQSSGAGAATATLSHAQKKQMAGYMPESFWINF